MVDINLFKRKCDLCGKDVICKYEPSVPFVVYCHECWWSDAWEALDQETIVDFSKPFLEQFNKLFHETPILGLSIDSVTGQLSPFVNHCDQAKNCYMIYYSSINEDSMYGFYLVNNKSVLNSAVSFDSELCFDNMNSFKNYKVFGSSGNVTKSLDCFFLRDCDNCQNCFASVNLRNKKYIFFNEQLTKEEYQTKISQIDLGSLSTYTRLKREAQEHYKNFPARAVYEDFSQNCTGSYVFESKNCKECFDVNQSQDSKYLMLMKLGSVKDCYDYTDWGYNAELICDCIVVGDNVSNIKFCWYVYQNSSNMEYSALCVGCKDCFGCVGLKKKQYCILNKQYTKEEYFKLREEIVEHMNIVPFLDKKGLIYKYGEYFPMEFSSYPYNNSFANLFFPKTKTEIINEGLAWYETEDKKYPITLSAINLPDNIRDAKDEIIKEVISCNNCKKAYKITQQELDLSRKLNVPLPHECPFCRINDKINKWVSQMKQVDRLCSKCKIRLRTHLKKEDAENILCKKCYQQEVY